ncbi:PspC domain-containing protein [Nesterenkonia flava]|uniref:LiaF-related protein n=1 Tax=Nesterenkonia flava TaxID=469799 RepID=A0ABU1FVF5_9MICC|nr:PspC domain-containing protein [Nesterenkonia flava]MDR5712455.1 LiaF-related protein [Nesterenkonia flava]
MENAQKPEAGAQFFHWLRSTGVRRPEGGWLGGVLAGASEKLGWDVMLLRGLAVVSLIIFFSPTVLLYGLAWLLLPNQRGEIHAEEAVRGNYTSGLFAGALLAVVGGVNIFTPVSIAGPFAVLINLLILAAVAWAVVALMRDHRRKKGQATPGKDQNPAGSTRSPAGSTTGHPGGGGTGAPEDPARAGKPAWYPKDSEPQSPPPAGASAAPNSGYPSGYTSSSHTSAGPAAGGYAPVTATAAPAEDPYEREERRRRRLITWGLTLLMLPVIAGLAWFSGALGISSVTAVVLGLAVLVVLMSLTHITAALRGRKGRGIMLGFLTVIMLVLVAFQGGGGGWGSPTNHAFGNFTTSSTEVNTAFSNTTVDLRDIDVSAGDPVEVNNGFGNTTLIVPDDVALQVDPASFLGNLSVHTQEGEQNFSGINAERLHISSEDSEDVLVISLNNAFGNVTIYDATTYAEEEGQ